MSSGSILPPTGGLAELGISYSTLQSTCSGTLKSLTRYPVEPDPEPDPDRDDDDDDDVDNGGKDVAGVNDGNDPRAVDDPADTAAAAAAAAAATIAADGTPAAEDNGLGYDP